MKKITNNRKAGSKFKMLAILSFAVLMLSVSTQIFVSNKAAVRGAEVSALEQRRAELTKETALLQLDMANLSSLAHVETEAAKLGFVRGTTSVAVIGPVVVAVLPTSSF